MTRADQGEYDTQPFQAEAEYELRIKGRLAHSMKLWFEDLNVNVDGAASPVQTVISGPMRDQAALYGLISRIRDLNLTLISVKRLDKKEDS